MEAQLQRMDALLTRLEGIVAALVSGTGGTAPSGASDRILPWQTVPADATATYHPLAWPQQTPEEKAEEQKKIDAIIEKSLAECQEPLPLAD